MEPVGFFINSVLTFGICRLFLQYSIHHKNKSVLFIMSGINKKKVVLFLLFLLFLFLISYNYCPPYLSRLIGANVDFQRTDRITALVDGKTEQISIYANPKSPYLFIGPFRDLHYCSFLMVSEQAICYVDDSSGNTVLMQDGALFSVKENIVSHPCEITEPMNGWAFKYNIMNKGNSISYTVEPSSHQKHKIEFTVSKKYFPLH